MYKKIITATLLALFCVSSAQAYSKKSHTGLDQVITIIKNDKGLKRKTTKKQRVKAIKASKRMNQILIEAINQTKVAYDGHISAFDAKRINHYIVSRYENLWVRLHGDDEKKRIKGRKRTIETGYHLVKNNGAETKLFGRNALNNVFDSIYHIGLRTNKANRVVNEDGKRNKSFGRIATYLNRILAKDLRVSRWA